MQAKALPLVALTLTACAAKSPEPETPAAPTESGFLETGGTLSPADLPGANVQVEADHLVVWGLTEVPDGSRLQAAYAMVDAVTRTELIKYVRVQVASVQEDIATSGPGEETQKLELRTAEIITEALPRAEAVEHGWARVQTDESVVLRIVGRLRVSRALLAETFAAAFDASHAEALISKLFAPAEGAP